MLTHIDAGKVQTNAPPSVRQEPAVSEVEQTSSTSGISQIVARDSLETLAVGGELPPRVVDNKSGGVELGVDGSNLVAEIVVPTTNLEHLSKPDQEVRISLSTDVHVLMKAKS
jgi:hypothetical protein